MVGRMGETVERRGAAFFMGVLWGGLGMGARRAPLHAIKKHRLTAVRKDKAARARFFFVDLRVLQ
ncbi:hypothetical protein JCM14469_14480 [Desulfatiferula olefinivorans]